MSKAYSNKALPPGTVLREWRLEEVLGVGGFGIVYKGRGIYFDELVAIKEYFPSSISERDAEATVVPIDSDAEEVHALGLKKFVEEAKLLWNLSTPSRHPNIVSVRSLFEIHGTAYMVMDFEDGVSLSKMLKKGTRFNERSLLNLVRPIAEGLERAHRVGVLHRDIKPPNILINDDGRPVLIDFGSARFESAEATSTKVTFHTPPYAAIEQYVKTYEQGPWTDIYALGVVLYECVTGEKPPEVLERMHGGAGRALSEGKWPGYGREFLAAVDAAMTIRPTERPQTISEWLAMFDGTAPAVETDDDEATRFAPFSSEEIVPVAPPPSGYTPGEPVETRVPDHPSEAKFKRAGEDTNASKKAAAPAVPSEAVGAENTEAPKKDEAKAAAQQSSRKPIPRMAAGIGAVALVGALAAGWAMFGGGNDETAEIAAAIQNTSAAGVATTAVADLASLAPSMKALAEDARKAGAPTAAVDRLDSVTQELGTRYQALQTLSQDAGSADAAASQAAEMRQFAATANRQFANALLRDAEAKVQGLSADLPWANPARTSAARGQPADRLTAAANLRRALAALRAAAAPEIDPNNPAQSLMLARQALAHSQSFAAASAAAYNLGNVARRTESEAPEASARATAAPGAAPRAAASRPAAASTSAAATADTGVSPAKLQQLNSIVADGRRMAKDVIRMGSRGRPGSGASAEDRQGHELRQANARLARDYDRYLVTARDSMRGVTSGREADRLIKEASETRAYLQFLVKRSTESLNR